MGSSLPLLRGLGWHARQGSLLALQPAHRFVVADPLLRVLLCAPVCCLCAACAPVCCLCAACVLLVCCLCAACVLLVCCVCCVCCVFCVCCVCCVCCLLPRAPLVCTLAAGALQKITLTAVVLEEKTSVRDIITAEQQHVLDAIAVRNMKTRKTMTHQVHDLVAPRCHFHTPHMGWLGSPSLYALQSHRTSLRSFTVPCSSAMVCTCGPVVFSLLVSLTWCPSLLRLCCFFLLGLTLHFALQELVQAVLSQCLFFRPDVRKVKQRIEDLMKRGFIRREDPTMHTSPYVYVPIGGGCSVVCSA